MNISPKFGSKINLSIARANGDIENKGEFHNHPLPAFLATNGHVRGSLEPLNFVTSTEEGTALLNGTFSQSGTTVTRESGNHTFTTSNNRYIFADGTVAGWRVGSGTSNTSVIVSRSQTVSAQPLFSQRGTTSNNNNQQELLSAGSTLTFTDGKTLKLTLTSVPATFPPATAAYTLRHIRQSQDSPNSNNAVVIDIYPPVEIEIGDQIRIESFEYSLALPSVSAIPFETSPIAGLGGSGRMQRLRPITTNDNTNFGNRIYLVSDENKMLIPPNIGPFADHIHPNTLSPLETVTASATLFGTGASNDMTQGQLTIGTVETGGNVKQILWGSTSALFAVVEFDEPVNIPEGSTLTLGLSTKFDAAVILPPI